MSSSFVEGKGSAFNRNWGSALVAITGPEIVGRSALHKHNSTVYSVPDYIHQEATKMALAMTTLKYLHV